MKDVNLLIVGIGPHARRIYVPTLERYKRKYKVSIKFGVDLKEKRGEIEKYLADRSFGLPMMYIDPFLPKRGLPGTLQKALNDRVAKERINGVIIATEPLVHVPYARWALSRGLNILMDKPISTRENVVSDMRAAVGIWEDYLDLIRAYENLQRKKKTIFSINVQRRYHPGFKKVVQLVQEAKQKFDAPVTSIQLYHADGQWRLPAEIVRQIYHPYCQGYGGCSHSGYHGFDAAYQYYKAGLIQGKEADTAEVVSSFLQPKGFFKQFREENYRAYFGKEYLKVRKWGEGALEERCGTFGEMDAFSIIRLLRKHENICTISLNILHNTFSRRVWLRPGRDLYKGNGRVKHEYHNIQQGPFQNIQIHSYQSNDQHEGDNAHEYETGGNNHFDIYVFRNAGMFGSREKPFWILKLNELLEEDARGLGKLTTDYVKEFVIEEFLRYIRKEIRSNKNLVSDIRDHGFPAHAMSAAYQSHILHAKGADPWVAFRI